MVKPRDLPKTVSFAKPKRSRLTTGVMRQVNSGGDALGIRAIREFGDKLVAARERGIQDWYNVGGQKFLDWTKEHYRLGVGAKLKWVDPFLELYYLAIGCPWLERIFIEKAAQMGYSESLIALSAFMVAEIKIPVGFGFETMQKMKSMVGPRVQPVHDNCQPIVELRSERKAATGRKDISSQTTKITIGGIEMSFFYSSTAKDGSKKTTERQASSSMSSFTAWAIMADEIELWPHGAIDIAIQRQSACEMPTKLLRAGTTPGQEGGIVDAELKKALHLFQWNFDCPGCGENQFLHPFGNMFKPIQIVNDDGITETIFIDGTGKPLDWHHSAPADAPVKTRVEAAHLACNVCGHKVTFDDLCAGSFRCVNTKILLSDLIQEVIRDRRIIHQTVAIRLPRLASALFKPQERLRRLIDSDNPMDELQQGYGIAISVGIGKIALQKLMDCAQTQLPEGYDPEKPDFVAIGVDQGQASNPAMVTWWWWPKDPEEYRDKDPKKSGMLKWMRAHKRVVWYGEVVGFGPAIDKLAQEWNADVVGVDCDPEINFISSYVLEKGPNANKTGKGVVYAFDQVEMKGEDVKPYEKDLQVGRIYAFRLHRTYGLDAVRTRIYRQLQYFPSGTTFDPGNPKNLFAHYLSSERNKDNEWVQQEGSPDHWFHADNFAEMAVFTHLTTRKKPGIVFTSLSG